MNDVESKARYAIHDLIWAASEDGLHGRLYWEDAQSIGDKLHTAGYALPAADIGTDREAIAFALFTVREQAEDWRTGGETLRNYWRGYADKLLPLFAAAHNAGQVSAPRQGAEPEAPVLEVEWWYTETHLEVT